MYRYIGDGSFLLGVPPRDLTDDEFTEYAKAFKEREGIAIEKAPDFPTLYKHEADKKSGKED